MPRFDAFRAQFYLHTNLLAPIVDGVGVSHRVLVSGQAECNLNGVGRAGIVMTLDPHLYTLVKVGHICVVEYADTESPSVYSYVPWALPFRIDAITPLGGGLIQASGDDMLGILRDFTTYTPVGVNTALSTTVASAVPDATTTTLSVGAPINNDAVTLTSVAGYQVGDEVRITLDGWWGTHITVVTAINPPGSPAGTIQIRDRMRANASASNSVERRTRKVTVASGKGVWFQVGVECHLTLNDATIHTTLIEEKPEGDVITMMRGAPDAASIGKLAKAVDYSAPATNDVSLILAEAAGWSAIFDSGGYSGTENGTSHAPQGETVYNLLGKTAQQSGEIFRLNPPGGINNLPTRVVRWKRAWDYAGSGGNLKLVQPTAANIAADATNHNRGIITGTPTQKIIYQPVTRVTPYGANKNISLYYCSNGAKLDALAWGYTVVTTGLGLYEPPYLKHSTAEPTIGVFERTVTFPEIDVETENRNEWVAASDALLWAAVDYMRKYDVSARYQYEVPDVVCAMSILPGQRVEMEYTAPDGSWSVNATGENALYVLKVTHSFSSPHDAGDHMSEGGIPMQTLTLMSSPVDIPGLGDVVADAIASTRRVAQQVARSGGG